MRHFLSHTNVCKFRSFKIVVLEEVAVYYLQIFFLFLPKPGSSLLCNIFILQRTTRPALRSEQTDLAKTTRREMRTARV